MKLNSLTHFISTLIIGSLFAAAAFVVPVVAQDRQTPPKDGKVIIKKEKTEGDKKDEKKDEKKSKDETKERKPPAAQIAFPFSMFFQSKSS